MTALYPWLTPLYQQIAQTIAQHNAHHAILIQSEHGLGAASLLQKIAKRLLCQTPNALEPCNHCHSCQLFEAHSHSDFHSLIRVENKEIGVEQVREMNEIVAQHSQQGGNKVILVEADSLTDAAANAILKTLEEPRPNTYFLLSANAQAALLPTIFSRCQRWQLLTPHRESASAFLANATNLPSDSPEIHFALAMAQNRVLDALTILQNDELTARKNFLRQFWLFFQRRSPLEILPFFDKEKERVFTQFDWILAFVSDALKCKLGIQQDWQSLDLTRGVEQLAQSLSAQQLLNATQILQQTRSDLRQINGVNLELMLLSGLTKLITEVFEHP